MQHGTDAQKQRFLPEIINADEIWCQGFSEPDAGSDVRSIKTTAVRVDGGWRINGRKMFISNAGTEMSGGAVMLARVDDNGRTRYGNFMVPTARVR